MKVNILEGFAGSCARLALFSSLLLNLTVLSQAQTTAPPPTHSAVAASTKPAAQPRGNHEGIKVHGHWTIEVRNPDGKLVSHTEFENSLVQPDGSQILTAMLLGVTVPGGFRVVLGSTNGQQTGPCPPINSGATACILVGSLISPAPPNFGDGTSGCGDRTVALNQITSTGPCFPLSIASVSGTGLSFMGTAVASTTSSITDVFLDPILCPGSFNVATGIDTNSPSACAQATGSVAGDLTHATLPTPVQITAVGQLIAVNVQLSFQ